MGEIKGLQEHPPRNSPQNGAKRCRRGNTIRAAIYTTIIVGAVVAFTKIAPGQMLIVGSAQVIDGDTIELNNTRIRLWGYDAPERDQSCWNGANEEYPCGLASATYLLQMVMGRVVSCSAETVDRYGRIVAICAVDGADIGEGMVRAGHALDWTRYSQGFYAKAEREARDGKRGMWSGHFQAPSDWRKGAKQ